MRLGTSPALGSSRRRNGSSGDTARPHDDDFPACWPCKVKSRSTVYYSTSTVMLPSCLCQCLCLCLCLCLSKPISCRSGCCCGRCRGAGEFLISDCRKNVFPDPRQISAEVRLSSSGLASLIFLAPFVPHRKFELQAFSCISKTSSNDVNHHHFAASCSH